MTKQTIAWHKTQIERLYELLHDEERRSKAYRHMLVEVCQELSGCKQDPTCFLLLCNLDELLKQEEKADRKRKR